MPSIRDEVPSDWLKYFDLPEEGCEATITGIAIEQFGKDKKDKKIVLEFAEFPGKRKICNTTTRRWLAEQFGDDTREWPRQRVYLYVTEAMSPTTHEMTPVIGIRLPRPPMRKPEPAQSPTPKPGTGTMFAPNAKARSEWPPAESTPPVDTYDDADREPDDEAA